MKGNQYEQQMRLTDEKITLPYAAWMLEHLIRRKEADMNTIRYKVRMKITWTVKCPCGRRFTLSAGQTCQCVCGRVYRA